jgi:hypothetical protein
MASGPTNERGGGIAFEENAAAFSVLVRRRSQATQAPSASGDARSDPRRQFWSGFEYRRAMPSGDADLPDLFEQELRANFDRAMTRQAFVFRRARAAETGDPSNPPPAANFAFRVGEFRYSSLEFTVGIVGLQALYKYFFSDPALVLAFLEACSPTAFAEALYPFGGLVPSDLSFAVTPAAGLAAAMATIPNAVATGAAAAVPQGWAAVLHKVQSIWWLLPTALALVVFYIAINAVDAERGRQQARQAALDARASQLDGALKDRVKELETLTLELVKQLAQAQAREPCCPACCVPKACATPPVRAASRPPAVACKG